MCFPPQWTEMRRPQGESFRYPLTVVSAVSRDLRKHCQGEINPKDLVPSNTLERLPLRMDGRGGTHHVLGGCKDTWGTVSSGKWS